MPRRRALLLGLLGLVLTAGLAGAGHEDLSGPAPWGREWFCTPEVALYLHPLLPVQAVVLEQWTRHGQDYARLRVYTQTPETPLAESVHEVSEGQLGPIVFFKTLPDGRVLCDRLPPRAP